MLAVEAISGVVSSASLVDSPAASTSVLRGLFLVLLSCVTGRLHTGHVRFPSVSHGSTHLQWYASNNNKEKSYLRAGYHLGTR